MVRIKNTFASTSCMDLSFQNQISVFHVEILGNFECLIGSCSSSSSLDKDTIFAHEVFALIFVKVEESLYVESEALVEPSADNLGNHML